jgi:hypothetical protein
MTKKNKYKYLHVMQSNYGNGFEDMDQSEDRREIRTALREFRENSPNYSHRMIQRRVLNRDSYKVVRLYRDSTRRENIKSGLTLEQAQSHCRDPETTSSTCTSSTGHNRTAKHGPWFDSYSECN